mgnify:CR=1 FL=1
MRAFNHNSISLKKSSTDSQRVTRPAATSSRASSRPVLRLRVGFEIVTLSNLAKSFFIKEASRGSEMVSVIYVILKKFIFSCITITKI